MLKGKYALIVFIIGLIVAIFNRMLGGLLMLIPLLTAVAPWIAPMIYEYLFGVPIEIPRFEEEGAYISVKGKRIRLGAGLRIVGVNYNVLDLDPQEWKSLNKAFIDGCVTDLDADYSLIYVKRGSDLKYIFRVVIEGEDLYLMRDKLTMLLSEAMRNMESVGIKCEPASGEDLKLPLKFERTKPKWWVIAPLALIIFLAYRIRIPEFFVYFLIFLGFTIFLVYRRYRRHGVGYRIMNDVVEVKEDKAAYRFPTTTELYRSGRRAHDYFSKLPESYVLVMKLKPTTPEEVSEIRVKADKELKWGEAMGKMEMLRRSEKHTTLVDRADKGEVLYKSDMFILLDSNKFTRGVLSTLDSLSQRASRPHLKIEVGEKIY